MQITDAQPTELFVRTANGDAQLLRVALAGADPAVRVTVRVADSVIGSALAETAELEVPLTGLIGRPPGDVLDARVEAGGDIRPVQITVAEPGWTVWMVSHFHYDPVWWNTQAAYTATWDDLGGQAQRFRLAFQQAGFALVDAHVRAARLDPDYKFVMAEVDYLKPYWDARPQQRDVLRRLIAEGRAEVMGGTYNEPNTNLTTAETTVRNFIYGAGFQRGVLGADPRTAWQLDAFGHDPQFPGLAAQAGLSSSSWARGPHHQWGPMLTQAGPEGAFADPAVMQFPSEFEWISPSGLGVLTHYMPAHYSAGWRIDSQVTLTGAEAAVYELFLLLKKVAATRNVLLPVGTDYTPPSKWVSEIHRHWNARYSWPRMVCALPREFFAAVRSELDSRSALPVPQTRDMNPVYTGKDVSFIDTKQAQRAAEAMLVDAEMFAAFAALRGAIYPHGALDKAWRQLVYGAHHDAITGSESDQVYLDLLTGWREAHELARSVLAAALDQLTAELSVPAGDGAPVTVFNPSAWSRADLVTVEVTPEAGARGLRVVAADSTTVPSVISERVARPDGAIAAAAVTFRASAPGLGRAGGWRVQPTSDPVPGWTAVAGVRIESARYLIEVDPARGGCVRRLFDRHAQREVLAGGGLGNELLIVSEYPEHPQFHEGPWHLLPAGRPAQRSSETPAESVRVEHSVLGQRITVRGRLGGASYTQRITLLDGTDRIDCQTALDGFAGADDLVRISWAADVPGALPVSDISAGAVGRGFAFPAVDTAVHPWTLDNPALTWFALSSTARVRVRPHPSARGFERAIGGAEMVAPDWFAAARLRNLAAALAGQGVTATTSIASGPRYGSLAVDSNLPDFRVSVGGPAENSFTAAVLGAADERYHAELDTQLSATGRARIWVPARRPLRELWQPGADLTGARDLPVLIVVGDEELAALHADLADAVIEVTQLADPTCDGEPQLADYTVAVLNTGMPSFNIDTGGTLTMSVLRSCTGWPSGVWIDPPRRNVPDGSAFQQQHWTHFFDYAVIAGAGDWRSAGLVRAGHELNHPLRVSTASPAGSQPQAGSYLTVDSATDVQVSAVKAAGNPLAAGRNPEPLEALSVRLVEAEGATTRCTVSWPRPAGRAVALDLLEQPAGEAPPQPRAGTVTAALTPLQIATIGLPVDCPPGGATLVADHEQLQPVYSRYWLHNAGPAPRGNLPVTVHSEPSVVHWPAAGDVELTVTVASDRTDHAVDVPVRLLVPSGWRAEPAAFDARLAPGAHQRQTVRVRPPDVVADGSWWIRAQATAGDQTIEDVTRIIVGAGADPELSATLAGPAPLARGETGAVEITLANHARTAVVTSVQLISPWHTWDLLPAWHTQAELRAGGRVTLSLPVKVPLTAQPGTWWLLAKLATGGLVQYTETVPLVVRPA